MKKTANGWVNRALIEQNVLEVIDNGDRAKLRMLDGSIVELSCSADDAAVPDFVEVDGKYVRSSNIDGVFEDRDGDPILQMSDVHDYDLKLDDPAKTIEILKGLL